MFDFCSTGGIQRYSSNQSNTFQRILIRHYSNLAKYLTFAAKADKIRAHFDKGIPHTFTVFTGTVCGNVFPRGRTRYCKVEPRASPYLLSVLLEMCACLCRRKGKDLLYYLKIRKCNVTGGRQKVESMLLNTK